MIASQVIDMQADLHERCQDETFRKVVEGHLKHSTVESAAKQFTPGLGRALEVAYAYRVTGDMTSLVVHAAKSLDDEDRFNPGLAPTACGIVRFDRPLIVRDVRGVEQKVHWLTWGIAQIDTTHAFGPTSQTGVMMSSWNDLNDPDEVGLGLLATRGPGAAKVLGAMGRWSLVSAAAIATGEALGPSEVSPTPEYADSIAAEGDTPAAYSNVVRYLHALWLLLDQTISNVEEEHVRSTSFKRAKRAGLPGRVSVVDLRRVEGIGPSSGESHVEWTRRWVVRGHWRWQPYGPGLTERRRIWISPHIRGPEGLPLVIPEKVYQLRR